MNFEDEFPSLNKYQKMFISTYYDEFDIRYDSVQETERVFSKIMIEKNCLDKQKVKQAIIKVKQWEHHDLSDEWDIELFKELGLEK